MTVLPLVSSRVNGPPMAAVPVTVAVAGGGCGRHARQIEQQDQNGAGQHDGGDGDAFAQRSCPRVTSSTSSVFRRRAISAFIGEPSGNAAVALGPKSRAGFVAGFGAREAGEIQRLRLLGIEGQNIGQRP